VSDRNAIRIDEVFHVVGILRFRENVGDEDVVVIGVRENRFRRKPTETRVYREGGIYG